MIKFIKKKFWVLTIHPVIKWKVDINDYYSADEGIWLV